LLGLKGGGEPKGFSKKSVDRFSVTIHQIIRGAVPIRSERARDAEEGGLKGMTMERRRGIQQFGFVSG